MREDAFRAYLIARGYTPGSVSSRLSRGRAIERRLSVDLDTLDLDDAALPTLARRLASSGRNNAALASELNALRTYRRFRRGGDPSATPPTSHGKIRDPNEPRTAGAPRSGVVTNASVASLLGLYGEILDELRERGVVRTGNAPVGDYAEWLFAHAFGWELAGSATAGYDATDPETGLRYQIKGRRTGGRGARQLGVIRQLDGFDHLAAVLFRSDLTVQRAAILPAPVVERIARRVDWVNGWRVMLTDDVWSAPGVRDVTARLTETAANHPMLSAGKAAPSLV